MTFFAGQRVTAASLNFLLPLSAYKAADESVTTSTTLQNDNDLVLPMAASATYRMFAIIFYTTSATADLKYSFSFPTGCDADWGTAAYAFGGGNTVWFTSQRSAAVDAILQAEGTTDGNFLLNGTFSTGSTAGNLQFRWAQNTSSGTSTVHKGSSMQLFRIA